MIGFVAGATGYTGGAVVARLRADGHEAIPHVRPDSSRLEEWRRRFGDVDTTAWSADAMRETLRERAPHAVFALLGTTKKRGDGDYESVDYGLTALLLDACVEAGHRPRFVYLSAAGVGPRSASAYMRVRWRLEEKLRASGLPFAVVRPSFISGDRQESRPLERLGSVVGDGALAVARALGARTLASRYGSVTAGELAQTVVRVAFDPAAEGRTFDAQGLEISA